ncbi:MAG: lytic transglycosylase domain-containing protein [Bacteroidaceae bacterium]|nr:lytic transglycosylase domain-containing protein [Bacteroidaceae bacterium]
MEQRQYSIKCLLLGVTFALGIGVIPTFAQYPEAIPPYEVVNPYVPSKMVFAGDTLDLQRADLHERIDRELITFTFGHTTTLLMFKRANRYFPVVEPILKECGVPDDFKYLMVIESNVDIWAYSPAGAAGLWQFMPATGKEFGLKIDAYVDERYHVEKATRAACDYLKEAYAKYGDWLTVAASYNAGQGRITTELAKQQVAKATDLWLNKETARYRFRILAAKQVFSFPRMYGFVLHARDLYPMLPVEKVVVSETISDLALYAKGKGCSYYMLKQANPWIKGNVLPANASRPVTLLLPIAAEWEYEPTSTIPHVKNWVVD